MAAVPRTHSCRPSEGSAWPAARARARAFFSIAEWISALALGVFMVTKVREFRGQDSPEVQQKTAARGSGQTKVRLSSSQPVSVCGDGSTCPHTCR